MSGDRGKRSFSNSSPGNGKSEAKPSVPDGFLTMSFSRLSILKLVELALAIVIVWLHYDTYEANGPAHLFIITATFAGFLIVLLGTFLGSVNGGINKNVDMFYCVLGAALFIASGALSIQHFNGWAFKSEVSSKGLTKGSLAIIEGAIFLVDAFFVFKA